MVTYNIKHRPSPTIPNYLNNSLIYSSPTIAYFFTQSLTNKTIFDCGAKRLKLTVRIVIVQILRRSGTLTLFYTQNIYSSHYK